ncbi:MAG: prepilin-type N-terminal cleavage/methylation domain-containing protein [Burkholderiales bacterium]|nr:prepilin-type N-terminal cleavage/methylation domain-containing protein [Burkholderiales bacterium]
MRHVQPSAANQCGFTLIELMIGITIGLMVVIAAIGSLRLRNSLQPSSETVRLQQKADAIFAMSVFISPAGATELLLPRKWKRSV